MKKGFGPAILIEQLPERFKSGADHLAEGLAGLGRYRFGGRVARKEAPGSCRGPDEKACAPNRRVPVPAPLLRAVASLADAVSDATGRRLPVGRKLAAQVLADGWVCDPSKARERLGFEATTPLADSVARAARWYRAHGWL